MKKTGRRLCLVNDITEMNPVDSIVSANKRLTTIFNDDREGYGWKVVEFEPMGFSPILPPIPMMLTTARPDSFDTTVDFGLWWLQQSLFSNSLVGIYDYDTNAKLYYSGSSIKPDHVAVNHLAILYDQNAGAYPLYKITLEEYEISDKEEIVFKLKEVGQNVGQRT